MVAANAILTSNYASIYEIYAKETFVEAYLTFLSFKLNDIKMIDKIKS